MSFQRHAAATHHMLAGLPRSYYWAPRDSQNAGMPAKFTYAHEFIIASERESMRAWPVAPICRSLRAFRLNRHASC